METTDIGHTLRCLRTWVVAPNSKRTRHSLVARVKYASNRAQASIECGRMLRTSAQESA